MRAGEHRAAIERRDDDVGGRADLGEDLLDARLRAAAFGRDEHAEAVLAQPVDARREPVDVADDRIERARREHRRVGIVGRRRAAARCRPWCARAAARTTATAAARRPDRRRPTSPRACSRARASSSSSSCARSRSRRGSTIATSALAGSRSERRCSSAVSHGSHDSMPSKVCPSASRSHCSRPHGSVRQQLGRAGAHFVGRQQLAYREQPRVGEVAVRTLVGDRELRQPVDLVAPEVDAHRMVGGRRVDVDDRTAHRELAARLDLVLAAVAHRDEPLDEVVAVDLRAGRRRRSARRPRRAGPSRCTSARIGATTTCGQVLATRAQPPHHPQAPAHRLGRGRHPFERQRLPRREQLDRVVAEVLRAGRRRPAPPRRASAPRASTGRRAVAPASVAVKMARAGSGTATV